MVRHRRYHFPSKHAPKSLLNDNALHHLKRYFGVFVPRNSAIAMLIVLRRYFPIIYKYFRKDIVMPILAEPESWSLEGKNAKDFFEANEYWLKDSYVLDQNFKALCTVLKNVENATELSKTVFFGHVAKELLKDVKCSVANVRRVALLVRKKDGGRLKKEDENTIKKLWDVKWMSGKEKWLDPTLQDYLAAEECTSKDVQDVWTGSQKSFVFLAFLSGMAESKGKDMSAIQGRVFDLGFAECRKNYWSNKENLAWFARIIAEDTSGELVKRLIRSRFTDLAGMTLMLTAARCGSYEMIDGLSSKGGCKEEALSVAAGCGRDDIVKKLLDDGANPADFDNDAFINACAKDKESVVKILLDHKKVDVSARKSQCIFEAVTNGNVELTRLFLSMDKVDPNGRRLLVEAGARCYSEVVSLLLSSPRFVPTEQDLRTCLANATGYYSNSLDVCRVLIRDKRVDPSWHENGLLRWACRFGHYDLVKELLKDERVSPGACNSEAFILAVKGDHLRLAALLLAHPSTNPAALHNEALRAAKSVEMMKLVLADSRVDPADKIVQAWMGSRDALETACAQGSAEMVRLLLDDHRSNPAADGSSCLKLATKRFAMDIVQMLVEDGRVDISVAGADCLATSCTYGKLDFVEYFLSLEQIDPMANDNEALCLSCRKYSEDIFDTLLKCGVDPSFPNQRPLKTAVEHNYISYVERLLDFDHVDPSVQDNAIFIMACSKGFTEIVERLMQDPRVNPDARDGEALRGSCRNGNTDVVRILLEDGRCDPTHQDHKALKFAKKNKIIVELFAKDGRANLEVIDYKPKKQKTENPAD